MMRHPLEATMNPLTNNQSSVESSSGSYPEKAMRAIRALHKQMRELGKRIQDETASPTGSGPSQQQLMRDLNQQMTSMRMELDVLQASIIQHQNLAALKKEQASEPLTPQPAQESLSLPPGLRAPAHSDEAGQSQGNSRQRADKMRVVGTVIDTTA